MVHKLNINSVTNKQYAAPSISSSSPRGSESPSKSRQITCEFSNAGINATRNNPASIDINNEAKPISPPSAKKTSIKEIEGCDTYDFEPVSRLLDSTLEALATSTSDLTSSYGPEGRVAKMREGNNQFRQKTGELMPLLIKSAVVALTA
ncbi:hypothetical protein HDU76_006915 [Blyttiomyces sp. JEL0837]|nr:hypothetical protein HDU76_006915 [Blyttiomyces sp. JEL0837]